MTSPAKTAEQRARLRVIAVQKGSRGGMSTGAGRARKGGRKKARLLSLAAEARRRAVWSVALFTLGRTRVLELATRDQGVQLSRDQDHRKSRLKQLSQRSALDRLRAADVATPGEWQPEPLPFLARQAAQERAGRELAWVDALLLRFGLFASWSVWRVPGVSPLVEMRHRTREDLDVSFEVDGADLVEAIERWASRTAGPARGGEDDLDDLEDGDGEALEA